MFCKMEPVSGIQSNTGIELEKKGDKDTVEASLPKQTECMVEIKIGPPAENTKKAGSPLPLPAKVEVNIETVSALGGVYTDYLDAQLKDLAKAKQEEKLPHIVINNPDDDETTVQVIVIVSFADSSSKLIHSGNFILEAVDTTTMMEVKKGISKALDIRYEDMSIACGRRFLSDCRSFDYYCIFDGVTMHLLVDTPDEVFKDVFVAFQNLGHDEETAAIATRNFIVAMSAKYNLDEGDNPILTQELLMEELSQFFVPDGYESDISDSLDSTDEDYSIDEYEYPESVFHIGELELIMMQEEEMMAANPDIFNENLIIFNLQDEDVDENSVNENANMHGGEDTSEDDDVDTSEDDDDENFADGYYYDSDTL